MKMPKKIKFRVNIASQACGCLVLAIAGAMFGDLLITSEEGYLMWAPRLDQFIYLAGVVPACVWGFFIGKQIGERENRDT